MDTTTVVAESSSSGSWRAAVPMACVALLIAIPAVLQPEALEGLLLATVFLANGLFRWWWWTRRWRGRALIVGTEQIPVGDVSSVRLMSPPRLLGWARMNPAHQIRLVLRGPSDTFSRDHDVEVLALTAGRRDLLVTGLRRWCDENGIPLEIS